ncbi:hypothetical protein ACFL6I_26015, partial [candidate division KSB1 bacterium]
TNAINIPYIKQLVITGQIPIIKLLLLNNLISLIDFVRPVYPAISNVGNVTTQGDIAMRSDISKSIFKVQGEGIKVGVLSDSYNSKLGNPASDDVLKGDLPGSTNPDNLLPVDVVEEYPYGEGTDEGRAMLQIIHDIAPKAELAFRTGFIGENDFARGIKDLQQGGCNIVVDDITYIS